jgi:hypothetical protein
MANPVELICQETKILFMRHHDDRTQILCLCGSEFGVCEADPAIALSNSKQAIRFPQPTEKTSNGSPMIYHHMRFPFESGYAALVAHNWRFMEDGVPGSSRLPENVICKLRQMHLALSALRLLLPSDEKKT